MDWFLYDRDLSQECLQDILDDVNRKCEEHMLKRVIEHKTKKQIYLLNLFFCSARDN